MKPRKFNKAIPIGVMITGLILAYILFSPFVREDEESRFDGDMKDDNVSQMLPQKPSTDIAPDFDSHNINGRQDMYAQILPPETEDLLSSDTSITDNGSLQDEYGGIPMQESVINQISKHSSYSAYILPCYRSNARLFPKEAYTMIKTNSDGVVRLEDLPDYKQAEYVIKKYINEIRNADIMRKAGVVSDYENFGVAYGTGADHPSEEPDPSREITDLERLTPPKVFLLDDMGLSRMERQRNLIIEQFGESAFDNVEYVLLYQLGADGHGVVILKSTLEVLSEEELAQVEEVFSMDVARREGVSYEAVIDNDRSLKSGYYWEYVEDVPWEYTTFPHYLIIQVHLGFNGKPVSDEGYENFHFAIHNRTGKWEVRGGLTWDEYWSRIPTGD